MTRSDMCPRQGKGCGLLRVEAADLNWVKLKRVYRPLLSDREESDMQSGALRPSLVRLRASLLTNQPLVARKQGEVFEFL